MAVANQSLVKANNKQTITAFLTGEGIKNRINQMVGGKDGQRFITSIISAVSVNPDLAECEHASILSAAMLGESLKLSPSPQLGQYYMVPFKDNKNHRTVATFQLGYKGYIQLAIRSGYYKKINVISIKDGELVKYDPLSEEIEVNLIEDDETRENTPTIGYYAMFEYHNGFRKTLYWSKKKMESHALKYSQGYASDKRKGNAYTFWSKDFDGMAYKTMLRQLISKWGIMSIELQTALEKDSAVINDNGEAEFIEMADAPAKFNPETGEVTETVVTENATTRDIIQEAKDMASFGTERFNAWKKTLSDAEQNQLGYLKIKEELDVILAEADAAANEQDPFAA